MRPDVIGVGSCSLSCEAVTRDLYVKKKQIRVCLSQLSRRHRRRPQPPVAASYSSTPLIIRTRSLCAFNYSMSEG